MWSSAFRPCRANRVETAARAYTGLPDARISSGANVAAAMRYAAQGTVLTFLCDTGERYFSLDEHFR